MKFFVSYGRDDGADFAEHIFNTLTKQNLDVFYDIEKIPKGTEWETNIFNNIDNSNYFILILTKTALSSTMVDKEVQRAKSKNIKIVPYKFKSIKWNECVKWDIQKIHGTEFSTKENLIREVLEDIVTNNIIQSPINPELKIPSNRGNTKTDFEKASRLSKLNQFQKSNEILNEMEKDDGVLTLQAWNYMGLQNYNQSLDCCNKATGLNPESFFGWLYKSTCLGILGNIDEALNSIEKAITINPESTDALYTKGLCYMKIAKYDEAINEFNKVVRINQYSDDAWVNIGVSLIELKKYHSANKIFEKALSIFPNDSVTWSNNAYLLLQLNEYEKSLNHLVIALELNIRNYYALYSSALLFEKIDLESEARKCFKICQDLNHKIPKIRIVFKEQIDESRKKELVIRSEQLSQLINNYYN